MTYVINADKKQWRAQLFEAGKRVLGRLANGKGFKSNCLGEDLFMHALVKFTQG